MVLCHTIWPAIWAKLSKWSWDSDSEKGISVFKTSLVSQYKAFLWKASNPILALRNLKKNGAWSVVTDHNRSPWRRSNQNQRQKLWSSSIEDHRFWSPETAWYISTTLCTYRTCFGHWTESWLKRTSVTSCDQCWWQHWELNRRRVLSNDSTPSVGMSYYKRTGNQDGGSCDGSELQRVILRLVGNGKTKAAYFGWNGRPFFVLLCDVETAAFMLLPWAAFMWSALWLASLWDHFPCVESFSCKPQANHFLKKWSVRGLQQINLCSQIFRLWIDHWLCNLTDNDNFLRFKNFSLSESLCCTIWPAIWAKLSKWSWDSDSEKGISVFKTNILSHNTRLFLWKASNPILALCNLKKMVVGLWHSKRNQCFEDKPCSLISFCHFQNGPELFSLTPLIALIDIEPVTSTLNQWLEPALAVYSYSCSIPIFHRLWQWVKLKSDRLMNSPFKLELLTLLQN